MIEYEIIEQSTVIGQFLMATTIYDYVYAIVERLLQQLLQSS